MRLLRLTSMDVHPNSSIIYKINTVIVFCILMCQVVRYIILLSENATLQRIVLFTYDVSEVIQFCIGLYIYTPAFIKNLRLEHNSEMLVSIRSIEAECHSLIEPNIVRIKKLKRWNSILSITAFVITLSLSGFLMATSKSWSKNPVYLTLVFGLSGFFGRMVHLTNVIVIAFIFLTHLQCMYSLCDYVNTLSRRTFESNLPILHRLLLIQKIAIMNTTSHVSLMLTAQILTGSITTYLLFVRNGITDFWTLRSSVSTLLFVVVDMMMIVLISMFKRVKDKISDLIDLLHSKTRLEYKKSQLLILTIESCLSNHWVQIDFMGVRLGAGSITLRIVSILSFITILINQGQIIL